MSPASRLAFAAAPAGSTSSSSRPSGTGRSTTPSEGGAPRRRNSSAVCAGTATPRPLTIAVLMPITRPSALASGPPELPGASRTSARIQLWLPMPGSLPTECTTPVESAPANPSGLPMAITSSPGRSAVESPGVAGSSAGRCRLLQRCAGWQGRGAGRAKRRGPGSGGRPRARFRLGRCAPRERWSE